jgi:hypothetical protein
MFKGFLGSLPFAASIVGPTFPLDVEDDEEDEEDDQEDLLFFLASSDLVLV